MTSRERFAAAMRHEASDRVPIDIGATTLTAMRPRCQQALRRLIGIPDGEFRFSNTNVDERILEWAGTDFRGVGGIAALPSPLARRTSDTASVDWWGVGRDVIDGESQIVECPLAGATREDLAAFPWPEPRVDEKQLAAWQERARMLRSEGRYAVVAEHPIYGILEMGFWMCGYGDFLLRLAADPDFVRDFFDRVLAIQLRVIEQYYAAVGPYIDLTMNGDDFGSQRGPLMSPAMFGDLVAPYFAERIRAIKRIAPGCYFWHHTCGSVASLLDRIIACGVDILNPIQTSAAGMDPESLKARFGDRIVFWGAVDVQTFLRQATPGEVTEGVRDLVRVLGRDGGFVIAPAHEIQDDVPAENVVAWVEAVRRGERKRTISG